MNTPFVDGRNFISKIASVLNHNNLNHNNNKEKEIDFSLTWNH